MCTISSSVSLYEVNSQTIDISDTHLSLETVPQDFVPFLDCSQTSRRSTILRSTSAAFLIYYSGEL